MPEKLSSQQIAALLAPKAKKAPKPKLTVVGREDPYEPQYRPVSKHVKWLDERRVCKPGSCSSQAYIAVDDKPLCLMHAFHAVVALLSECEGE